MKLLVAGIFVALAADAAHADADAGRCDQGADFARKKDLPRAALYLEGCTSDEHTRLRADVTHKLDESKLSAITIVTTPEGMVAETDAMPGERFPTPATVWTKAGEYTINVAPDAATLDAGKGITTRASIDPFSRRTVILNMPSKKATEPKAGKVDFNDEPEEQSTHKGPPPAHKFDPILPDKYRKKRPGSGGPFIDDPLAVGGDSDIAWRLGARIGGGVALRDSSSLASVSVAAIAARSLAGPVALQTRLGWTRRDVDSIALEVGIGVRLASTPALVITASAAARGDVRVQDTLRMEDVARVGLGASTSIELALLSMPLTFALRAEPAFTELTPGVRAHGLMLELGYDWR